MLPNDISEDANDLPRLPDMEYIRSLVREGRHYFYTHALTEAKKDGVAPEDVVYVILNGEVIEEYPRRQRLLIYGDMTNGLPLHVVCDTSAEGLIIIPTVYVPDDKQWIKYRARRRNR